MIKRREFIGSAMLLGCSGSVVAESYPSKVVRIVAFGEPGSPLEIMARAYAEYFKQYSGANFVIETRPGASGIIAADNIAKSPPDGYSLFFTIQNTQVIVPLIQKTPYDPIKDFSYITPVGAGGPVLLVRHDCPANNIKEFITWAKNKGRITYGTWGNGTLPHLVTEYLKKNTAAPLEHVPYKGQGKAHMDVLGGVLDCSWANPATAKSILNNKDGQPQIKILGITGKERNLALPDVPTFKEQGFEGVFESESWFGFLAPAGTPGGVIQTVHAWIRKASLQPDLSNRVKAMGLQPNVIEPEEFLQSVKKDIVDWASLVKQIKI